MTMRIGELARRAGVSVPTLRYYERRRLLRTPRRSAAGYRLYDDADLELVDAIKKMKRFGFTLAEIRRVVQLWAVPDGKRTPKYRRGDHACLVELAEIARGKLARLDAELARAAKVRDDLAAELARVLDSLPR